MNLQDTVHIFDKESGILTYDNGDFCLVSTAEIENESSFEVIKNYLVQCCNISESDDVLMFA